MILNYNKICQDLLSDLPQRTKDVILRRFGLKKPGQKETLEAIGESYGITRERVRQIEEDGTAKLKPKIGKYQEIFQYFANQLEATGGLKKEDILLNLFGGKILQNHVFFLLTLSSRAIAKSKSASRSFPPSSRKRDSVAEDEGKLRRRQTSSTASFTRFSETKDFYSLWATDSNVLTLAKKAIASFYNILGEMKSPLIIEDLKPYQIFGKELEKQTINRLSSQALQSFLEISKLIQQNPEGLFGLKDWPEINPRGIKDKAYLILKNEAKPLHFTKITQLIGKANLGWKFFHPNLQSVHNELIRDPRFVLVGRGLYALRDWGYEQGVVKDIIFKVLKEKNEPLSKKEIVENVLKQRFVKENTILLNLNNKEYFLRTPKGKYTVREI
ncbi:MAG: hypothetical protein ISS84_01400 [Candidatus Pacebacteria bacterium]|nr:hypothetical protein [Candidatus Paceibacterota bacterium]